jgi:transposase-like protein
LTIKEEELNNNYCPECYDSRGIKHNEFETIETKENIRYKCEDCHYIIYYSS